MDTLIKPRVLKGFRDYSPAQMRQRTFVIEKIRTVVESFGFDQLETPTLEYEDILVGNIGEDEKLIYRFTDDGDRKIALRYDQTVGACRYIAMNLGNLPLPFKRYQISNVFRAENTQKGRSREFLQFDADIFGVDGEGADIEMILVTCDIYKALGFKNFIVKLSDRALLTEVPYEVLVAIDKLDKIGKDGVISEIKAKGFADASNMLEKALNLKPNERIEKILAAVKLAGFEKNVEFDPSIMRAFSYSTGPVWEVRNGESTLTLLGGERFDSLVSRFVKQSVPGVGFGLGLERTMLAMEELGLLPESVTASGALIAVFSEEYLGRYIEMASQMRDVGINTEIYPDYKDKLGKQFKYADRKKIKFVLVVAEDEIKNNTVTLKNMQTGDQIRLPFSDILSLLKKEYAKE